MNILSGQVRRRIALGIILAWAVLASSPLLAREPPLQIGQYAHTSWTARDGYSLGLVFSMAQTRDGYLWLGGEFGLFRFDGLKFMPWQPPGSALPSKPYSLLVARDGTLWIGTFEGLVSWNGTEMTRYPEIGKGFVTSLLEDREGTVWAGVLADKGSLCEVRQGHARCHEPDGSFGRFVWSLAEDREGVLWVGADSGLWRWRPGTPLRVDNPGAPLGDLITSADGQLLIGMRGSGLRRIRNGALESIPIRGSVGAAKRLTDQDIKSNKLLRDRKGGIWIGTDGRGLVHVQDGVADTFSQADGLSGNIACSLFEDREGNIWFASERGLDRFRELPVVTLSQSQGLSSDVTRSVVASPDGAIWLATNDGVTRWKDGSPTVFGKSSGLPDSAAQSLYQDVRGRIWVSTGRGLAYLEAERFIEVPGLPGNEVFSISGDRAGNLWLSGHDGLRQLAEGRLVANYSWASLGRRQQAKVVIADQGGVWLAFWQDGGVLFFKDGEVRARYGANEGLGADHVSGLRLDADGALWAATEGSGG